MIKIQVGTVPGYLFEFETTGNKTVGWALNQYNKKMGWDRDDGRFVAGRIDGGFVDMNHILKNNDKLLFWYSDKTVIR